MKRAYLIAMGVLTALIFGYVMLTSLTSYPSEWDEVGIGTPRKKANDTLTAHEWQQQNSGYLIEHRSWLRVWRIDVNFTGDTVSDTRIYSQDPHEYIIQEIGYLFAELGI